MDDINHIADPILRAQLRCFDSGWAAMAADRVIAHAASLEELQEITDGDFEDVYVYG